jgi:hypothetical protein
MEVSGLSRRKCGALPGESALLCPDGESFSSGRDDAGGQPFKVDASAEDRVHGLL